MTDWGRLFVVILNRGDETPAQFSNYLPSWERTENNNEFWILFFYMKQTSSICPAWEAAHPQLRWRAGWESRCPGVQGMPMGCSAGGRGAGAGGCLPCFSWPPPQQPLDTARCLLPGQGLSPDLLSTPGSLHKSVKETWGVQNSGGKNSFLGKRRKQNKTAKP